MIHTQRDRERGGGGCDRESVPVRIDIRWNRNSNIQIRDWSLIVGVACQSVILIIDLVIHPVPRL